MEMHSAGKPYVEVENCIGCGNCIRVCAHDAPKITDRKAFIDHDKCVGCGRCIGVCPKDAVCPPNDESNDILNKKIAEYSLAVDVYKRQAMFLRCRILKGKSMAGRLPS